jgi:hypothetical protein
MQRTRVLIFYLLVMLLCVVAILYRPMAFQKSAVITEDPMRQDSLASDETLDVAAFIGSIDYTDQSVVVYNVHPREKYERTIRDGLGNCSNLSFGAAYDLRRTNIPYDIVFFLPREEFLDGLGHAILSTRCIYSDSTFDCLVDVLEAGLPMSGTHVATLEQLRKGAVPDFSILSLNRIKDADSNFYGEFLDRSTIGILEGEDIDRYFSFIESTYVSLGNRRLEKLLYDGMSVLFAVYPPIRVQSIADTFKGAEHTRLFYLVILWTLRVGVVIGIFYSLLVLLQLARRLAQRASGPRGGDHAIPE